MTPHPTPPPHNTLREAAAFSCVSTTAKSAANTAFQLASCVRIKRNGEVLPPANECFDSVASPNEPLNRALERCPAGGSVLLMPGSHGRATATRSVHMFGQKGARVRGLTIAAPEGAPVTLDAVHVEETATLSSGALRAQRSRFQSALLLRGRASFHECSFSSAVTAKSEAVFEGCEFADSRVELCGGGRVAACRMVRSAVCLRDGAPTVMEACDVAASPFAGVLVVATGGPRRDAATVRVSKNRVHGCTASGIAVDEGASVAIEGNVTWGNLAGLRLAGARSGADHVGVEGRNAFADGALITRPEAAARLAPPTARRRGRR